MSRTIKDPNARYGDTFTSEGKTIVEDPWANPWSNDNREVEEEEEEEDKRGD